MLVRAFCPMTRACPATIPVVLAKTTAVAAVVTEAVATVLLLTVTPGPDQRRFLNRRFVLIRDAAPENFHVPP